MSHSGVALIDPHKIFEKIALGDGMRVADMGCGRTGHFVFPASKAVGERGVVYAVEIMKDILANIESRVKSEGYGNVHAVWSDIEKFGSTPIPPGSLDVCFFVNVFFLLKNRDRAVAEAKRLLKDGGYLVIVDWRKKIGPLGPDPEKMVAPEEIKKLGMAAGLEFLEKGEAGDYHYFLIFKNNLK